jgi:hypothetical protein
MNRYRLTSYDSQGNMIAQLRDLPAVTQEHAIREGASRVVGRGMAFLDVRCADEPPMSREHVLSVLLQLADMKVPS